MIRVSVAFLIAATIALRGCRSCVEEAEHARESGGPTGSGPPMPTGMLVPTENPAGSVPTASSLRVTRQVKSGPWAELQVARPGDRADRADFRRWRDDSAFVSLEAMTMLHEAFARALPGFDLFLPRLYAPDALSKLAAELDAFAGHAEGPIAWTARELATLAKETAAKGASLWVLGP